MKSEKQLYQLDVNQYLTELQPTAEFIDYPMGNEVIRIKADGTRCRIPDDGAFAALNVKNHQYIYKIAVLENQTAEDIRFGFLNRGFVANIPANYTGKVNRSPSRNPCKNGYRWNPVERSRSGTQTKRSSCRCLTL